MDDTPEKSRDVETKNVGGETFILSIENSVFYKLNRMGTKIWELIDGIRNLDDIADDLIQKYDVDRIELKQDIEKFIEDGREKGFII